MMNSSFFASPGERVEKTAQIPVFRLSQPVPREAREVRYDEFELVSPVSRSPSAPNSLFSRQNRRFKALGIVFCLVRAGGNEAKAHGEGVGERYDEFEFFCLAGGEQRREREGRMDVRYDESKF